MPIQSVVKMGNAQLATPSVPFAGSAAELRAIVQDMQDTMQEKGGIGIAAPQIGINQRIVLFGFDSSERYPNAKSIPFTVLINPVIHIIGDEMGDGWEGCLSVPGMRGLVPRYTHITYSGYDMDENPIHHTVHGFHARVVQHECDHLDGILYPERIKDMHYFGFEDELGDIVKQSLE